MSLDDVSVIARIVLRQPAVWGTTLGVGAVLGAIGWWLARRLSWPRRLAALGTGPAAALVIATTLV